MKRRFLKRILVTFLIGAMTVSALPVSAFAAPVSVKEDRPAAVNAVDNEKIAKNAYDALQKAQTTGSTADYAYAYKLIAALTPTQRVHFFLLKYAGLYKLGYNSAGFPFFNVSQYLIKNPDVIAQARLEGKDPIEFALEHYLSMGIFEGRSSCTAFDPIVAIVAYPEETMAALLMENGVTPNVYNNLKNAFTKASGDNDTTDYKLGSLWAMDINQVPVDDSRTNSLYIIKEDKAAEPAPEAIKTSNNDNNDSGNPSSIEPSSDEDDDEGKNPENPGDNPGEGGNGGNNPGEGGNGGNNPGEGGNGGTGPSDDGPTGNGGPDDDDPTPTPVVRKQVVMVYMCGSDLDRPNSPGATSSIAGLLASGYDPGTTEIYLLAGGAKNWQNELLNNELVGADQSKLGNVALYKLNIEALDDNGKAELSKPRPNYDLIINGNTLSKLDFTAKTSPDADATKNLSTGDPATLTAFIDNVVAMSDNSNATSGNAPSDIDYNLILWNHGGGYMSTICSDMNHTDPAFQNPDDPNHNRPDGLTSAELKKAFEDSNLNKSGKKLALLGFDACLMGQYELAATLSPFYDYMIGTAESERGDWDYNDIIGFINTYGKGDYYTEAANSELNDTPEKCQAASQASLLYRIMEDLAKDHSRYYENIMPYNCFSSLFMNGTLNDEPTNIVNVINSVAEELVSLLQFDLNNDEQATNIPAVAEAFRAIRTARSLTRSYGDDNLRRGFEYADLGEFLFNLGDQMGTLYSNYESAHSGEDGYSNPYESINRALANYTLYLQQNNFIAFSSCYMDGKTIYSDRIGNVMSGGEYLNDMDDHYSSLWEALGFGSHYFLGTSIYFPTTVAGDTKLYSAKIGQEINADNELTAYGNLLKRYNELYYNRIYGEEGQEYSEIERIKGMQGYSYDEGTSNFYKNVDLARVSFADMLSLNDVSMKDANGVRYLHIPFKTDEAYGQTTSGENKYSSGNALLDYADTVGAMKLYTLKQATTDKGQVAIICASSDISLSNINLENGAIDLLIPSADNKYLNSYEKGEAYYANGYTYVGNELKQASDIPYGRQQIEKNNENTSLFDKLVGTAENAAQKLYYFFGQILTTDEAADYQEAKIYFKSSGENGNEWDTYQLVGASTANDTVYSTDNADAENYNKINKVKFYHYAITPDNNTIYTVEKGYGEEENTTKADLGIEFVIYNGSEPPCLIRLEETYFGVGQNGCDDSANKYALRTETQEESDTSDTFLFDNGKIVTVATSDVCWDTENGQAPNESSTIYNNGTGTGTAVNQGNDPIDDENRDDNIMAASSSGNGVNDNYSDKAEITEIDPEAELSESSEEISGAEEISGSGEIVAQDSGVTAGENEAAVRIISAEDLNSAQAAVTTQDNGINDASAQATIDAFTQRILEAQAAQAALEAQAIAALEAQAAVDNNIINFTPASDEQVAGMLVEGSDSAMSEQNDPPVEIQDYIVPSAPDCSIHDESSGDDGSDSSDSSDSAEGEAA